MIHIITQNAYLRLGLKHLFAGGGVCINILEHDRPSLEKELLPSDIVIYHVDKTERLWVPKVLSISLRARVILLTSSSHLRIMAISNVIAMIDENASLASILSTIKENYSYNAIRRRREIDLTAREHYVLAETVRSTPSYTIARLLDISVKTVSSHKRSAYRKLGIRNIHDIFLLKGMLF